jgi:PIN domain nuclease of toxin-antitoxin system
MAVLLDTCSLIWASGAEEQLSPLGRSMLSDPRGAFFVSAASCGEVACAQERKRLELPLHWKPWFRKMLDVNGWECLPVSLEIIEEAYSLPGSFHADPVDRILVATARLHDLVLLTADSKILAYPHVKARW